MAPKHPQTSVLRRFFKDVSTFCTVTDKYFLENYRFSQKSGNDANTVGGGAYHLYIYDPILYENQYVIQFFC